MSIRFRLSPELSDGEHYSVVDTPEEVCEAVSIWSKESDYAGANITVETVEMSQDDVDALPDI